MQLLGLFLVLAVTIGDGKVMDSNALQDQVPPLQRHVANLFASFCEMYGKHYLGEEKSRRLRTFEESMASIATINARNGSWTAGLNQYSDLTWAEFQSQVLMEPQDCSATAKGSHVYSGQDPPPSIDWEAKGALNPVKNQGHCGSCWTFSTTGTLESHHYLATGMRANLSEQQLVDCAGAFNNNGCNGGLPSQAFEYIHFNGGLDTEDSYPYKGVNGNCSFKKTAVGAKVAKVMNITYLDEEGIVDAVAFHGPVSIAYQVADDFRHYKSGIYNGNCAQDRYASCIGND
jgi:cathepsin H